MKTIQVDEQDVNIAIPFNDAQAIDELIDSRIAELSAAANECQELTSLITVQRILKDGIDEAMGNIIGNG